MILRSILSGGICAVAGLWAMSAAAEGARPYLSWPGKVAHGAGTQAVSPRLEKALPNPATGAPGFDIPPSPYGQVGSPYAQPVTTVPVQPVRVEVPRPADVPPPPPKVASVVPSPARLPEPVAPQVVAPPVVAPPAVAEVPAPAAALRTEDGAFVLPPTSKYATRPAASSSASDMSAPLAQPSGAAPNAQDQTQVQATAPALSEPLIVPETESVFVPGMRVTDPATQSPRFYSLHRAYGYQPDPVENQGGDLKIDPARVETKD